MTHAPKIGALQAYAEGLLSDRGRARVARHLAGCETCRRTLASIELYRTTVDDVRAAPAPELDWSKMELALAREARAVSATIAAPTARARRRVPRDGAIAMVLAAAAVLALALWPRSPSVPVAIQEPGPSTEPTPAVPEEVPTVAIVTLASGIVRAHDEAGERIVEVGSEIVAGERITTGEGSSMHAAFATGTGLALAASTEIGLAGADGSVELALARGAVTAQLAPEASGAPGWESSARFVVLAAEHRFVAHGTRFEVELDALEPDAVGPAVVRLEVAEGEVAVHRPDGSVVIVRAPGSWSSVGGEGGDGSDVFPPHGLSEASAAWPVVRVQRPGIVRWEIGDVRVAGIDGIAMRAPPGELAIAGFDAEGVAFRTVAIVGADGLALGADALVAEPPRVSEGFIPEEDVVDVVEAGAPRLQRCYELALRTRPDLEARAEARVTVAFDGTVARVQLRGDDLPPAIEQCVRTHLARWTFPPPRGGSTFRFDLPIDFAPRR